jgi:hypothetical protein
MASRTISGLKLSGVVRDLLREAARAFGVPVRDLSRLVYACPELLEAASAAEARLVAEADALLLDTIRGDDVHMRAMAAELFLDAAAPTGKLHGVG